MELPDLVYFVEKEICIEGIWRDMTRRYFSAIVKVRISGIFCNQSF